MINIKCNRCGVVNVLSNEVCKACGLELAPAPPPAAPMYSQPLPPQGRSSSPTISSIKPFDSISDVLGTTITLFTKNIWMITKLVLVVVTPFQIFSALSLGRSTPDWQLILGTIALQTFCGVLIAPALIYSLMKVMQTGEAPGINEAYRWGLGKLGKLLVCTVIAWVLEMVGLALCIIPGIYLFLAFQVVYPIAVLEEGHSPIEILKRSRNLTKDHLGNILGASIVMAILISIAGAPLSLFASWLVFTGVTAWPLQVLAGIVSDILSQGAMVLSLVFYLSIMRTLESSPSVIE